ncbi:prolyl oligopeptidase family serine peptidase [Aliiglaciecola sp. LCG003]|uniref:prolyl oligopeptidase family serine peptidase n=1 Tax=Aliiglaciecola sp. LCG003 TaxID=3053655 RepID=UPI002572254D|nr:prolyl oligopeptidase family serine peptidase [Aliiglaciecola sp. LCG003]WJG11035.1 prolyl oligopeptidase family serine peptidase [Aliiglaciecola sp. LCG003]
MRSTLLISSFVLLVLGCAQQNEPASSQLATQVGQASSYPVTRQDGTIDDYFGQKVADPYRWLEDDMSEETAQWVKDQNLATLNYLQQIPSRQILKERLTTLFNYQKVGAPFKEGQYTYFYQNDGLQNQYVLYRQQQEGEAEVFLDPNKFSDDGTTSMSSIEFSEDGTLATYLISEGGSDWRTAVTIDTESKQEVTPRLNNIKFSGIAWKGNQGFFYSSYDKPQGSELSAKTDQHKLYYHQIGTTQSDDKVIFGAIPEQKHRYVGGQVTRDAKYLLIRATNITSGNKLYLMPLNRNESVLVPITTDGKSDTYLLDSVGDELLLVTNLNAPNKRIVKVKASQPSVRNWHDLIAETDDVLAPSTAGGFIYAHYMVDAISLVKQFDMQGNLVRQITLPGVGTASGFDGKREQTEIFFNFQNYKTPYAIYKLDVASGQSILYRKPDINFDSDLYESKQVFYASKDGTQIPMILTYKKGLELNGTNPTILYGYGGFNINITPKFSSSTAAWLEQGGVYAVANLRGGGEYGKKWHNAGIKMQKQNVFDDFIAAAEFLIEQQYTSPDYLAIRGGSNGGLLVGAVMLQRPELFRVALPAVGVLDMLRYHTFTSGAGWAYDYGTSADSPEMFNYLLGYSPLHNVKAGVQYPATLITTGDHDDRVVPAHSFKFAAELQQKYSGGRPMLIRIETNAGHGAGTPTSKTIQQYADIYGFVLHNMGLEAK